MILANSNTTKLQVHNSFTWENMENNKIDVKYKMYNETIL